MMLSSAPTAPSICFPNEKKSPICALGYSAIAGHTKELQPLTSDSYQSGPTGRPDIVTRAAHMP